MARRSTRDARRYDPRGIPTAEEELELARRARGGDMEARNELVERNQPLAIRYAASVLPPHLRGEEDAYQEAFAGLIQAVDGFDPERGHRLSTYARQWIIRYVREWQWQHQGVIKLPSPWHRANGAANEGAWDRVRAGIWSLDYRIGHRDVSGDTIPSDGPPIDHNAEQADEIARLENLLRHLKRRDRMVLVYRFGLDGAGVRKLDEIGRELGVTREYVRQLQIRALARLRRLCGRESA